MKTNKNSGIKVGTSVKAGGFATNHTGPGLKVTTGIRAGGAFKSNHSARALTIA